MLSRCVFLIVMGVLGSHVYADSTLLQPSTTPPIINSGYNLTSIMYLNSNAPPNYSPQCPAGSAFSGGQFIGGGVGSYYSYNCTYLNIPANSELATQLAPLANGFAPCPSDPSNPSLSCSTKYNSFPITVIESNSCYPYTCSNSVAFGDRDDNYANAFTPVGSSPTIVQLSSNGTRGNGWDLKWPSDDPSTSGYNVLQISAYVFPNTTYQVYIEAYRSGGWRAHCPVFISGPNKKKYNPSMRITFQPEDIGKTCMFSCSGTQLNEEPDFYYTNITKNCY